MNPRIEELMARIRELEAELEADLESRRAEFKYQLENHRVRFEKSILAMHRKLRTGSLRYLLEARFAHILTAPVIYSVLPVMWLLDLFVSFYQWICFPIYGIPRVKRQEHFVYDRALLRYLNVIERVNCLYCSYGNGLFGYVREIAARTEQFWCPIKHARHVANPHSRYPFFAEYGDAENYRAELARLRSLLDQLER